MAVEHKRYEIDIALPYRLSYGPTWTRFLNALQEKQILATRCQKCERVLVPARTFCPQCFVDTEEWLEVSQEGKVVTWAVVNFEFYGQPQKPPYIPALIKLDGADVSMFHLIGGFDMSDIDAVKKILPIGRRVQAVWSENRTGHVLDIMHFSPI